MIQGKRVLYIGNMMMAHGQTATTIETLGPLFEREGATVYYASSKNSKILRLCDMIWTTLRRAKSSDYVVIDTYGAVNFWYAFTIGHLCWLMGVKFIPFLHGGDLPRRLKKSPLVCRMLFSKAMVNVAPSGYLLDIFKQHGFLNLSYIPNTVELANYPFLRRDSVRPKMLWVRAISPIYNPIMALDVFESVRKEFPDAELCLVGPNKQNHWPDVEAHAKAKALPVRMTGRLSKPDWIALSKEFDIFLNTTHFDNMPVSVVEALALGLPVVTTNVGGLPYLVKDGESALLVNDDDRAAMVDAIRKLVADPTLAQRLSTGGREIVEDFDWERVKHRWAALFG